MGPRADLHHAGLLRPRKGASGPLPSPSHPTLATSYLKQANRGATRRSLAGGRARASLCKANWHCFAPKLWGTGGQTSQDKVQPVGAASAPTLAPRRYSAPKSVTGFCAALKCAHLKIKKATQRMVLPTTNEGIGAQAHGPKSPATVFRACTVITCRPHEPVVWSYGTAASGALASRIEATCSSPVTNYTQT